MSLHALGCLRSIRLVRITGQLELFIVQILDFAGKREFLISKVPENGDLFEVTEDFQHLIEHNFWDRRLVQVFR